QRNELRRVARLHPHEDRTLAVLLRVLERTADVGRIGNLLAADLENDVAGLDAVVGGDPVGIDVGNHHAFRAAAGDLAGGYDREAEPRHVGALRAGGVGHRRRARLTLVRQFTECDGEGLLLALAPYRQFRGGARRHAADLPGEISGVFDRVAVDRHDHVTGHDAGFGGRAVRLRVRDQRALRGLETEIVGDFGGDGLGLHADPAAADLAVVLELSNDRLHGRSGDGKGDAYRAARGGKDGGIDADHVAVDVEGRAAGIAFVDRRIDLNEVVVRPGPDVATTGRDDTGGHRAAEAERISDRGHPVADARGRVREVGGGEIAAAIDLDQGDVGTRVGADHLGGVGLTVIGRHLDGAGLIDHVVIGHGVAVGSDEEAGALACHEAVARRARFLGGGSFRQAEATEETLDLRVRRERQIALEAHHLGAASGLDADRHDGGVHLVDDIGKTPRALGTLGLSDRGQSWTRRPRGKVPTTQQHGHAKAGDASKQNETTRREDARFLSGNARSHNGHSIVGAAGPSGTRCTARWATLPYRALSEKLKFGKVGKLQKNY